MTRSLTTMLAGAATVAAVATGAAFTAAPAEALEIQLGNRFEIGSTRRVRITQTGLDFGNNGPLLGAPITLADVIDPDTGDTDADWFTNIGATGTASDVAFSPATLPQPFLSFNLLDPVSILAFDLVSPISTLVTTAPGGSDTFSASFEVLISNIVTGQTLGKGLLTAQVRDGFIVGTDADTSSFSISVTAVPTPAAVLPGLLGLGAAAFRKKNQESEGDVAGEAVEVRA